MFCLLTAMMTQWILSSSWEFLPDSDQWRETMRRIRWMTGKRNSNVSISSSFVTMWVVCFTDHVLIMDACTCASCWFLWFIYCFTETFKSGMSILLLILLIYFWQVILLSASGFVKNRFCIPLKNCIKLHQYSVLASPTGFLKFFCFWLTWKMSAYVMISARRACWVSVWHKNFNIAKVTAVSNSFSWKFYVLLWLTFLSLRNLFLTNFSVISTTTIFCTPSNQLIAQNTVLRQLSFMS